MATRAGTSRRMTGAPAAYVVGGVLLIGAASVGFATPVDPAPTTAN